MDRDLKSAIASVVFLLVAGGFVILVQRLLKRNHPLEEYRVPSPPAVSSHFIRLGVTRIGDVVYGARTLAYQLQGRTVVLRESSLFGLRREYFVIPFTRLRVLSAEQGTLRLKGAGSEHTFESSPSLARSIDEAT
jgi:hypothetical protein